MLIYQLDAFVFSDRLRKFLDYDVDYIGAPWVYGYEEHVVNGTYFTEAVGNGGFSLRRTKSMIKALKTVEKENFDISEYNEDVIFSYCGYRGYLKLANVDIAKSFATEIIDDSDASRYLLEPPFGCHGWIRYSSKMYLELIQKAGIVIGKKYDQMRNDDWEIKKKGKYKKYFDAWLSDENSFIATINKNRYESCSIFGFGNYGSRVYSLLKKLNVKVSGIYDNNPELIGNEIDGIRIQSGSEVYPENSFMIVSNYDDIEIVDELEAKGFVQGENLFSLHQNYINDNVSFSIITVTRNCVSTIEKTIKSVLNQNYKNYDYIIVDGASSDGTQDIINRYLDKLAYYVSEPDTGIYNAMNKGISNTSGKMIMFLNGDDTFVDSKVLRRVANQYIDEETIIIGRVKCGFKLTENMDGKDIKSKY